LLIFHPIVLMHQKPHPFHCNVALHHDPSPRGLGYLGPVSSTLDMGAPTSKAFRRRCSAIGSSDVQPLQGIYDALSINSPFLSSPGFHLP
jgi:hypothetical protein